MRVILYNGKMVILLVALILIFTIIIFFAFPSLSPIPYYPTNWKDLKIITEFFPKDVQSVLDLGAGSGTVLFVLADEAYKNNRKTEFIALEINPFLVLLLHAKRLFHPNRKHITIQFGDLFKVRYEKITGGQKTVCYLYVSPRLIPQILKKIKIDIPSSQIVSYMYEVKSIKASRVVRTGNHPIYLYNRI